MNWKIENGIIKSEDNKLFPTAREVFLSDKTIKIQDNVYDFNLENLVYSRMFALDIDLYFNYSNDAINLCIYTQKSGERYLVKTINNKYLDYIIINNTWHYLDSMIEDINSIIDKAKILSLDNISIAEYLTLVKEFNKEKITFEDKVSGKIKDICLSNSIQPGINGTLFDYQEKGVKWLSYMAKGECGCILGDQPGLGKTLQIIALLNNIKKTNKNQHFLIIAPVSLLENWKREIDKFCPNLKTYINYGKSRINYYKELLNFDVIITSYNGVQSGFSMYKMVKWDIVALDEAQAIKNPQAKRTQTIKDLDRKVGIVISGTPFENHMTDVWSLCDFVLPGYLGDQRSFEANFEDNLVSANILEQYITPIMIRRKVKDVAKDLPEKIDIPQPINMTIDEAKHYNRQLSNINELKDTKLEKIIKLRMFCTHPSVYDPSYENIDPSIISYKYQRCCEIVNEIVSNNEKALIFTSFNKMIDLLVNDLKNRFEIPTMYVNGSIETKERQNIIDCFNQIDGPAILVLNPTAAGTGLNITSANHVIHYNLEWNPAKEDQASARAYRRGQQKTVFIYRLYYTNTIEEVMNDRIERKRLLSDNLLVGNQGDIDARDLIRVLNLKPECL